MTEYLILKILHVLSATVLFGTGLGIAWFTFVGWRAGDVAALRVTMRHVVLADWIFSTTAIVVQAATGVALMRVLGLGFDTAWFAAVAALFLLAGACWIPVVFIQYRLAAIAREAPDAGPVPEPFHRLMRIWTVLGVGAFAAVLGIFWLMVFKPGIG